MMPVQAQQRKGGSRGCPPEVSPDTFHASGKKAVRAAPSQGCDVYPLCLECPLPRCVYEEPGGEKGALRQKRNEEIRRLFQKGTGVEQLAFAFKLSFRSIYRIVGDGRREKVSPREQGVRQ
jgi:hypothetical protein